MSPYPKTIPVKFRAADCLAELQFSFRSERPWHFITADFDCAHEMAYSWTNALGTIERISLLSETPRPLTRLCFWTKFSVKLESLVGRSPSNLKWRRWRRIRRMEIPGYGKRQKAINLLGRGVYKEIIFSTGQIISRNRTHLAALKVSMIAEQ
jgi:hypothetical protein